MDINSYATGDFGIGVCGVRRRKVDSDVVFVEFD